MGMGLFSPAHTDRARGNGLQLKCAKFHLNTKHFCTVWKNTAQATQRDGGVTISRDIQSPDGHGPGQTALADTA